MKRLTVKTFVCDSKFELDYELQEQQLFDVTDALCKEFGEYLFKEDYNRDLGYSTSFLCHMLFSYLGATLGTCDRSDIAEVIEELAPRKCVLQHEKEADEFIDGLIHFFTFLKTRYRYSKAEEFIGYLVVIKDKFRELMFDTSRAGMSKSIFMNQDGSMPEFDSVEDLERFIMDYNQHIEAAGFPEHDPFEEVRQGFAHMDIGAHRKIGRNEPCPCGSGKKYKKCCGKPN